LTLACPIASYLGTMIYDIYAYLHRKSKTLMVQCNCQWHMLGSRRRQAGTM